MEQIRLNKYLAQCGVCSRREADRLIEQGSVLVNGEVAQVGQIVNNADEVKVGSKTLMGREQKRTLAFYKPVGIVCTEKDVHAEKTINDLIQFPVRVAYAGRLDKDSEGLLILTNDGNLIHTIMGGANEHEKEYFVRVNKEITDVFISKMAGGIYLPDLGVSTKRCKVEKVGRFTFRIILTQGLNRQIKRMCRACGYHVRALKRIRVMNIVLGQLKPGEYREILGEELQVLYKEAGLKMPDLQE